MALDFEGMQAIQRELQERYKDKWEHVDPAHGRNKLLWMLAEAGEAIQIIKKKGDDRIVSDPQVRRDFIEELCDVMMFLNDVCLCYDIKPEEIEILANIVRYLSLCALFYAPLALIFVFRNAIQGMGYSVPAMTAGLFELLARAVVAIGFVRSAGYIAAILAHPIAWIAADIFLIPMYIYVMRRFKKNPPPQIQES